MGMLNCSPLLQCLVSYNSGFLFLASVNYSLVSFLIQKSGMLGEVTQEMGVL